MIKEIFKWQLADIGYSYKVKRSVFMGFDLNKGEEVLIYSGFDPGTVEIVSGHLTKEDGRPLRALVSQREVTKYLDLKTKTRHYGICEKCYNRIPEEPDPLYCDGYLCDSCTDKMLNKSTAISANEKGGKKMSEVQPNHMYEVTGVFEYEGVKFADVHQVYTLDFADDTENDIDALVQTGGDQIEITISSRELKKVIDLESGIEHFGRCETCEKVLFEMPGPFGLGYVCAPCAQSAVYAEWGE